LSTTADKAQHKAWATAIADYLTVVTCDVTRSFCR